MGTDLSDLCEEKWLGIKVDLIQNFWIQRFEPFAFLLIHLSHKQFTVANCSLRNKKKNLEKKFENSAIGSEVRSERFCQCKLPQRERERKSEKKSSAAWHTGSIKAWSHSSSSMDKHTHTHTQRMIHAHDSGDRTVAADRSACTMRSFSNFSVCVQW